jgi:hypothetical protein
MKSTSALLANYASRFSRVAPLAVSAALGCAFASTASAQFTVTYGFNTGSITTASIGGLQSSALTAGTFTAAPGLTFGSSTTAGHFTEGNRAIFINSAQTVNTVTDLAGAFAADDYVQFTLTPAVGFTLDLDQISFQSAYGVTGVASRVHVFSSITGLTASTEVIQSFINSNTANSFTTHTLNLPQGTFGSISSAVTFRFYITDAQTNTDSLRSTRIDNLIITGTAIPEASTFAAIAGLASIGFVASRRRRR